MALVLTIATIDRTSVLIVPSLKVEQIAGAFTSTCTFDLVDEDKDITIYAKDAITLVDGATTFFAGTVATIDYINFGRDSRRIKVACQDYNSLCASVVIDGSGGHSPFEAVLDEVIIDTLFDEYLPAINSHNPGGGGFVDGGHLFVDISFVNMTMAQMLDRICSEADAEWYVDNQLYLHYFIRSVGEDANLLAWGLSDDPGTDAARTNLVDNPSFEVNVTDFWDSAIWDTEESSATQVWVGDYSGRFYEANFLAIAAARIPSAKFAVDPNTDYILSFYLYKAICTGTGTFIIQWYTAGDAYISAVSDTFDAGTHGWQRYNISATSPPTAAKAVIWLFEGTGVTNATELELFYDGVLFEEGTVLDDYFDGTSPFCTWAGAAHNSNSNFAGATTYAYFADIIKKVDSTQMVNEIFVIGGFGIGLWYDDAASVAAYGTQQGLVVDNTLLDIDDMEDRGESVLSRYATPQSIYSIKTQKDGARAGKEVAFKNEMMGVNILTSYTIKKLSITWPQGFESEIYGMDLGGVQDAALRASGGAWDIIIHDAIPNPGNVPLSSRGWTQAIGFSATDHETVAWAGGSLVTADAYVFTIAAGDTDNPGAMADTTYVFLDVAISQTVLQKTTNVVNAVGANRILVAVCENVAAGKLAIFQAFGGEGQGVLITADHIVANTITTNEIAVNTILAGNIAAGAIETDELDALAVTTVKLAAGAVTAAKFSVGMVTGNLCDCSVFRDDEDGNGEHAGGWTSGEDADDGAIAYHGVYIDAGGGDTGERDTYTYYGQLNGSTNGYTQMEQDSYIPVDTGEIYTLSGWASRQGIDPNALFGVVCYDAAKGGLGSKWFVCSLSALSASPIRYDAQITGEGAATNEFAVNTKYIRVKVIPSYHTGAGNHGSMWWRIQFEKSDYPTSWVPGALGNVVIDGQTITVGVPGAQRVVISGGGIDGYSAGNVKQFYLDASDGKGYFGAGDVILDVDGMSLVANDTGDSNTIKWYDGADVMSKIQSFYAGGASPAILWLAAYDDGDPWTGARVQLRADGGGDVPELKIDSDGGITFDFVTDFQVLVPGPLYGIRWFNGDFTISLGDAVGAKSVLIKDSGSVTVAWVSSDGDASFLNLQTSAEATVWRLGGVAVGTITPDRKVYVNIAGNWYTLDAQVGIV